MVRTIYNVKIGKKKQIKLDIKFKNKHNKLDLYFIK